jgi:protein O-GlcNAc transferase
MFQEGMKYYKQALAYNFRYPDAYYNLGVAYGEQLKYEKAIVNYELAIHFNPMCWYLLLLHL